ncbi:hypothetical protein [Hoyosella altamirensis]|uniref:Prokaryotic phospholipase A2 n=1 Tax=Hoyosella altamirensis TaxID=616997 RepID=A0A839RPZ0_9ACTN|nr:hypothetical protein [Hoyosella altamirensis]MBB3037951.1 hypothetical protein [Hoyosella altamirensis]
MNSSVTLRRRRIRYATGVAILTALALAAVTPVDAAITANSVSTLPQHNSPGTSMRAITAFTSPYSQYGWWPSDFPEVIGYTPQLRDGIWMNIEGDCSSPVPLPAEFTDPCREHDLGYDLLRYASSTGDALGSEARQAIDEQFAARLEESCERQTTDRPAWLCGAAATTATTVVRANSLRQANSVPRHEPLLTLQLAGIVIAIVVAAVGFSRLRGFRKNPETSPSIPDIRAKETRGHPGAPVNPLREGWTPWL